MERRAGPIEPELQPGCAGDHSRAKGQASVSAIIPAFNEASTILEVIQPLVSHPLIDEIIVVDDGSTDDTATRARTTSARVISLGANSGKAAAMDRGVEAARNEILFFLDADLHGLTPGMVTALVEPVILGDYDMFVAIRDRRIFWLNRILYCAPILGGERVLTKSTWVRTPRIYKKKFQIEIALNYYTKKLGGRMGFAVMPGLTHVIKERKRGFWLGLYQRLLMIGDIVIISFRLYVIRNGLFIWAGRRALQPSEAR